MIAKDAPTGRLTLGVIATASVLAGCAALSQLSGAGPAAQRERAAQERATAAATEQLRRQTATNHELELQLARTHLALLEREAMIRALQEKLDLATLEVVRAMGKLRGVESKAEAAANFAEAEIALKLLDKDAGRGRDDVQQARHLMKLATEEFKKENYAGTIYLSGRVKALSATGPLRTLSSGPPARLDGEATFSLPLPLKVVSKSNVREGPALDQKIAFVVEDGGALTGHSQKDLWVRVSRDDGRSGWIYYNRVSLR